MKKIITILLLCLTVTLIGCKKNYDTILGDAVNEIIMPDEVSENISLPQSVKVAKEVVSITWESNNDAITTNGDITRSKENVEVTLTATFAIDGHTLKKEYKIIVLKDPTDYKSIISRGLDQLIVPKEISYNLPLIPEVKVDDYTITFTYESNNEAMSNEGIVNRQDKDVDVILTATGHLNEYELKREFTIKVLKKDKNYNQILEEAFELIEIPETISGKIELVNSLIVSDEEVNISYKFDTDAVKENGDVVIPEENDIKTNLEITLSTNGISITKSINDITIKSFNTLVKEILDELNIPTETNKDIELVSKIGDIELQWTTSNRRLLTDDGKISFTETDKTVELGLVLVLEDDYVEYLYDTKFEIIIKPYDALVCIEKAHSEIVIETNLVNNIVLNTEFLYGVTGKWTSSNEKVLSSTGMINPGEADVKVTLTLELSCRGETRTYTYDCLVLKIDLTGCDEYYPYHNLVDRVKDFKQENLNNLEYKDGKIVLKDGAIEGTYESKIFKIHNFTSVVGSYSCISNENATGELMISIRINGTWSKYFTYGVYGLGRNNLYYDDSDAIAEISTDEINVLNDKTADAVKYKFIMRRTSASEKSPVLSLVAMAFKIPGYVYNVDVSNLPKEKDNDLPKLYQYAVPKIGGTICSATTTTMLLKWKGFDFSNKGYTYEHEYMANMVADRGHNNPTYGNWSYNMITAGAFGVDAYVVRTYSWNEAKYLLNTIGPIGTNVRGYFGSYNTNGHLVVLRGYRETASGTICIFNDPAVKNVYVELPLETFLNCWRGVSYIIE